MNLAELAVRISEAGAAARPDLKDKLNTWSVMVQERSLKALGDTYPKVSATLSEPLVAKLIDDAVTRWQQWSFGQRRPLRQFMVDDLQAAIERVWGEVGFFDKAKITMKAAYLKTPAAVLMRVHTDVIDEISK